MRAILRACTAVVCVAAFLLAGIPASSQSVASLHGNITDPSGATVANATVHLIDSATNADRTTTADPRGSYAFPQVSPGTYRLVVEAQGLERYEQDDIHVAANAPLALDVKMKIKVIQQNVTVTGQEGNQCLVAEKRVLPDVGLGLRAIRRGPSGNYYALIAPGAAASIYSADGKRIGQVPAESARTSQPDSSVVYGSDLEVDSAGRVYIADRAANAIKIYSSEGNLVAKIRVPSPVSVEPLADGEVAVASLFSTHLVDVYDLALGQLSRSFGDIADPRTIECDSVALRCTTRVYTGAVSDADQAKNTAPPVNHGWFYGDSSGNIYVNLTDSAAPTIRKYDAYGYLAYESGFGSIQRGSDSANSNWRINPEVRLAELGTVTATSSEDVSDSNTNGSSSSTTTTSATDAQLSGGRPSMGGGMRGMEGMGGGGMDGGGGGGWRGGGGGAGRGAGGESRVGFGVRISQRGGATASKPVIEAMSVDPENEDVWAAIGGNLVHFDKDGKLDGYYCLSTADETPVKPTTLLVEPDRILIGTDPFGIFQYSRPDKPLPSPAAPR